MVGRLLCRNIMTTATFTSTDLNEVIDGLLSFLRAEVVPRQHELEATYGLVGIPYTDDGRFAPDVQSAAREIRMLAAAAGYYGMLAPEEIGGAGLGHEALFRIWETVYHFCGGRYWLGYNAVAHWSRGPSHLFLQVNEGLRADVLPSLIDGSSTMCFAMSEPDAGSDVWMMRTRAVQADGGWILSGTKQWITNAPYADYAFVFAVTDGDAVTSRTGGITAFLVPTATAGFRIDSTIRMFGHRGGDEAIVSLNDVFVPESAIVGEVGGGLRLALSGVSVGRLYNTARAVGLAQWALEQALVHAEERITFGKPIIENQAVSFPLANNAMEIHAARLMGIDCSRAHDQGRYVRKELCMAKAYATETAVRAIDHAMQVHGALGFTNELHLSEAWQQARRICVADGSAEIMRQQIVKHLRKEARLL